MSHCARTIVLLLVLLSGCASMSDLKPGDGRKLTIRDHDYPVIWRAALFVAEEHFDIHEQDIATGVILAYREASFVDVPAWIGIYITPPVPGAAEYIVEVVRRKAAFTIFVQPQPWERKVLRDLALSLEGRRRLP